MINWSYDIMYKWYTKQHMLNDDIDDTIIAIVYDSKKPSKDQINLEPFIKSNIKYVGLSPLQDKSLKAPIYLVYDDNKNNKQWLYLVKPEIVKCMDGSKQSFLAANHYSFCYDKSDKKRPCHFHSTNYICNIREGATRYYSQHIKDFMPDTLNLPDSYNEIFTKHLESRGFLINFIEYPWKAGVTSGGTGSVQVRNRKHLIANTIRNRRFCSLWNENEFKRMTAFGVKVENKYYWTITFFEKGRMNPAILNESYVLVSDIGIDYDVWLQEKLAAIL